MKIIAKTKSVAVYIEHSQHSFVCEFEENGSIIISTEFNDLVNKEEVDDIFKKSINPIIEQIVNLLEQNGYKLKYFTSLTDNNIEIKPL